MHLDEENQLNKPVTDIKHGLVGSLPFSPNCVPISLNYITTESQQRVFFIYCFTKESCHTKLNLPTSGSNWKPKQDNFVDGTKYPKFLMMTHTKSEGRPYWYLAENVHWYNWKQLAKSHENRFSVLPSINIVEPLTRYHWI